MAIKLFNTLTRKKEIFKPIKKGNAGGKFMIETHGERTPQDALRELLERVADSRTSKRKSGVVDTKERKREARRAAFERRDHLLPDP